MCKHNEGAFIPGTSTYVDRHDCEYVDMRNRMIDRAMQEAGREVSVAGLSGHVHGHALTRAYMAAMGRLCGTPDWDAAPRRNEHRRSVA